MSTKMESSILDLSIKSKDLGHKDNVAYYAQPTLPSMHTPPYEPEAYKSYDFPSSYYQINSTPNHLYPAMTMSSEKVPVIDNAVKPIVNAQYPMLRNEMGNFSPSGVKKPPRPFKVYPNVTPLLFAKPAPEMKYEQNSNEGYESFRMKMLDSVRRANKGTNAKMRRDIKGCAPSSTMDDKDEAYREKRKKNNEAAKRSRDARKQKEDEIAIRAAYLEGENMWLKQTLRMLQEENAMLRKQTVLAN